MAGNDYSIIIATKHNHLRLLKHLIRLGCNPGAGRGHGLIEAAGRGHLAMIKYLITFITRAAGLDSKQIIPYAQLFGAASRNNQPEVFLYLARQYNKTDPLILCDACYHGNLKAIKYLMRYEYTPNELADAIFNALMCNNIKVATYLSFQCRIKGLGYSDYKCGQSSIFHRARRSRYLMAWGILPKDGT
jgi:hypothetical protein